MAIVTRNKEKGVTLDLFTTCEACNTVFKVTTAELRVSSGTVRCGYCRAVFDAFDTLTSHIPIAAKDFDDTSKPEVQKSFEDHLKVPDQIAQPEPTPAKDDQSRDKINLYETEFRVAPRRKTIIYFLVLLIFGAAAFLQWLYIERQAIAAKYPSIYGAIIGFCSNPECGSSIVNSTIWLDIESSDLVLNSNPNENNVELGVLIRNKAFFDLKYPTLEISLQDKSGNEVHRRLFLPIDYLEYEVMKSGFKADSEIQVEIGFDVELKTITDYRLTLLPSKQFITGN